MAAVAPEAIGKSINLGSGREISIGDLAQLIGTLVGRDISVQADEVRLRPENSEVERLIADNTLAQHILDWRPRVSLEEGLKLTIDWMREHLDWYRPGFYTV